MDVVVMMAISRRTVVAMIHAKKTRIIIMNHDSSCTAGPHGVELTVGRAIGSYDS